MSVRGPCANPAGSARPRGSPHPHYCGRSATGDTLYAARNKFAAPFTSAWVRHPQSHRYKPIEEKTICENLSGSPSAVTPIQAPEDSVALPDLTAPMARLGRIRFVNPDHFQSVQTCFVLDHLDDLPIRPRMKALVQDRTVVDPLPDRRQIANGDGVHARFPAPAHKVGRHDMEHVVYLPGFLALDLAVPPALARVLRCWRFYFARTFCQYRRMDLISRPLYINAIPSSNTAVIAWVSPRSTATLRCPNGSFASTSTTRWALSFVS
jgi:hypothetical protein